MINEITFPALNLKLHISRIAFSLFGVNIYWYAILITFAIALAIFLMNKDDKKYNINFDDILLLIIITIPIAFIGARIYYVIFNSNYYFSNPAKILNIRDGGLAIYGGIIAGTITIIMYCKIKKINILDVLDYVVPYVAMGQAIGRWGNFINVEAYGTETSNLFRMGIIENNIYKEVHPTFLYESIVTFFLFIFLFQIKNKRKYSGQLTYIYLTIYSIARFFIEGLRTDSLMLGNIRISQLISLIIFIFSILMILINEYQKSKETR